MAGNASSARWEVPPASRRTVTACRRKFRSRGRHSLRHTQKSRRTIMSKCGAICEVFSRVCGYFRPVTNWNKGKQEEFKERKVFEVKKYARKNPDGKSSAGV
ncbi:hypothetical protein FYJ85_21875 [Victivallaceae bacterium BBE-744-WT-12]|uniref:Uncharacterized protein n=1 Tax=Victivallis lenta TaxID=2606640 RepID=A0A844G906_9BACT|nr:hypothetical protein [Victivallis lenta]